MRNIKSQVDCHHKYKKAFENAFSCPLYVVSGKNLRPVDPSLALLLTMRYNESFRYRTVRLLNYWLVTQAASNRSYTSLIRDHFRHFRLLRVFFSFSLIDDNQRKCLIKNVNDNKKRLIIS